jgi:glycosyltransferase involved in cell wall biosynthesis
VKLLFVTPYLPSPPRFGGQRRLDGMIRGLARRHEVSLLSFVDPREDVSCSIRMTETYCKQVVAVPNDRYALTTVQKRLLQTRSLLSRRSFESFVYHSPTLQQALEKLVTQEPYDIVSFEFAQMVANLDGQPGRCAAIFVLDEHNIEYDILRRTASSDPGLDRKLYSLLDWRKLRAEEHRAWQCFEGCTVTSARDQELLRRDFPRVTSAVVPNAVDIELFRPSQGGAPVDRMSLLFFGAVSYHPNTDGLLFFMKEILPSLRARYPSIKLKIVGPFVPAEIQARADDCVEVVGYVDDIRPHLERATVIIAPLRIGGGTRFKILEAMAMGKAVVSTTIGAEGIDVRSGLDIMLADKPEEFAIQVGRLLEDEALRRTMGAAARALIERRYSWEWSVARLVAFYAEILARRGVAIRQ